MSDDSLPKDRRFFVYYKMGSGTFGNIVISVPFYKKIRGYDDIQYLEGLIRESESASNLKAEDKMIICNFFPLER